MQWYEGSIAEAVEKAKETSACLVVFVEGEDDASTRLEQFFADETVSQLLQQSNFVAIRFTQQSNTYMHFASIYKVVPVPSVFFIGTGGTPLEIGTGLMQNAAELVTKIKNVLKLIESNSSTSVTCEDGVCTISKKPAAAQQKEKKEVRKQTSQNLQASSSSAAAVHKAALETEMDEHQLRAEHLRQVQQKIRRNKLDEQAARERVLAQIAADRQERAQSSLTEHAKETSKKQVIKEPSIVTAQQSNIVRLQFRLANGVSRSQTFDVSDPLSLVREFVRRELLSESSAKMLLAIAYPKRELTTDCDSQTLGELGLSPSAVILVIMLESKQHSKAVRQRFDSIWTVISKIIWALVSPLMGFANYLGSFIGRRATANAANAADAQAKKDDNQRNDIGRINAYRRAYGTGTQDKNSDANSDVDKRRWAGGSNVYRLSDQRRDDDDDNATWNGNSTQQQ